MDPALALPRHHYWGDLCPDPTDPACFWLPLRGRLASALPFNVATREAGSLLRVPSAVPSLRLRVLHRAGCWLATTPADPMALLALERESGTVRWRYAFAGRFDPDARLALALDADGTILLAGCGIPGLVRLDAQGQLLTDYYAAHPHHAHDFAWRGITAVAPGPAGQVLLVDRHMYGILLRVDQSGVMGELGQRRAQTMAAGEGTLNDPCWVATLPDGSMLILELGPPLRLSWWNADGRWQRSLDLPAAPWHYLAQPILAPAHGRWWMFTGPRRLQAIAL